MAYNQKAFLKIFLSEINNSFIGNYCVIEE